MAEFTPEQRSMIRRHYGVPDVGAYADSLMGTREARFDLDVWMNALEPTGKAYVLQICAVMDDLLRRQVEVADVAEVQRIGDLTVDPDAFAKLEGQYNTWRDKLKAALNPHHKAKGGGGVNGTWCR